MSGCSTIDPMSRVNSVPITPSCDPRKETA
jgi:hypothetical protein